MSVLESLMDKHPIIDFLIKYRSLEKLLSTYVNALPQLVSPVTGKIHSHFNQTVAITGQLSSSAPNLQNIPVRTQQGKAIRSVFISSSDIMLFWLLIIPKLIALDGSFISGSTYDRCFFSWRGYPCSYRNII